MQDKKIIYLISFIIGTVVPFYFIFGFIEINGLDIVLFIKELFHNKASSTFSSDLLICSFIFWIFMANDKKGRKMPNLFLFIGLNLIIGLSSAMPLYLYFRQKSIEEIEEKKGKIFS
jgi:hypothetical protein